MLVLLALFGLAGPVGVGAQEEPALADLWIDLSIGPPLVELFNKRAQPQDIARVEHISQLDLLSEVTTGKKLVVFKSAADAIRLLPHIHDQIDIVGYNLEHGPANPVFEQENPLESIQRLREVTDEYGLELALGPDHRFAESDGVELAPYADYFILQVQKVQTDAGTVYDFVEPLISGVREANPDIQISLQIRTEGDVDDLLALLEPLQSEIDGISILTSEETLPVTEEIVGALRPKERVVVVPTAETVNTPRPRSTVAAGTDATHAEVEDVLAAVSSDVVAPVQDAGKVEEVPVSTATEIVSVAETTERTGSTLLFVVMALVVGFAIGAGYVSHRTGS